MKLSALIESYITFKKSLGFSFKTNENVIRCFARTVGLEIEITEIAKSQVIAFIDGKGPLTRTWHVKYNALKGLYKYAIRIGCAVVIPLPSIIPKQPPTMVPYIYSNAEIKRILAATDTYQTNRSSIEPITVRTIILSLYGAGLRGCEVVSLTVGDVDIKEKLLTVRDTKCGKSRIVPVGEQLGKELHHYACHRQEVGHSLDAHAPFFILRSGHQVNLNSFRHLFRRLRKHADVFREDGARYQPRLHDFRHSFAVHRLISWYQQGCDAQKLIHHLSVYLGHVYLVDTQVYLTMTPQLLDEANSCFENYALGDINNETD